MAERTLVLATGNAGKLRELAALLEGCAFIVRPQSDFAVDEAAETGLSFVENAIIKARNAARHTGLPAIADDSGLVCDALVGAPGIHSARYAGADATDAANLDKLLAALAAVPDDMRGCRFVCAMVYLAHAEDPCPLIAQGRWEGQVARAPRGTRGFGYDPVFVAAGGHYTAAELDPVLKNEVSHRGQALRALVAQLRALDAHR
ncbi:MAG: RdgB/HAM1 family non-canonical purine NTP pyrophosphatase [Gammaproteobacteria bacterium]